MGLACAALALVACGRSQLDLTPAPTTPIVDAPVVDTPVVDAPVVDAAVDFVPDGLLEVAPDIACAGSAG